MKPKTLSSTLATPYDTYFQVQVTMNSERHPQTIVINIFALCLGYTQLHETRESRSQIYETF